MDDFGMERTSREALQTGVEGAEGGEFEEFMCCGHRGREGMGSRLILVG